jgi:hypothetical protein
MLTQAHSVCLSLARLVGICTVLVVVLIVVDSFAGEEGLYAHVRGVHSKLEEADSTGAWCGCRCRCGGEGDQRAGGLVEAKGF